MARRVGQGEGAGDAVDAGVAGGQLGVEGAVEDSGFNGPGAAETPGGSGHLVDDAGFHVV
jgi:hypothetical protein